MKGHQAARGSRIRDANDELKGLGAGQSEHALRVQVPNDHILAQILYLFLFNQTQVPNYWVLGPSGMLVSDRSSEDVESCSFRYV